MNKDKYQIKIGEVKGYFKSFEVLGDKKHKLKLTPSQADKVRTECKFFADGINVGDIANVTLEQYDYFIGFTIEKEGISDLESALGMYSSSCMIGKRGKVKRQ